MSRNIKNQLEELRHQDKVRRLYSQGVEYVLKHDNWFNLLRGGSATFPTAAIYRLHRLRIVQLAQYVHDIDLDSAVIPLVIRRLASEGITPVHLAGLPYPEGDQIIFDIISAVATLDIHKLHVSAENTMVLLRFDAALAEVSDPYKDRPFTLLWTWKPNHGVSIFEKDIAVKVLESKANADALILMVSQGQLDSQRAVQAINAGVSAPLYSGAL